MIFFHRIQPKPLRRGNTFTFKKLLWKNRQEIFICFLGALCSTTFTYRTSAHNRSFYYLGSTTAILSVVLASSLSIVAFSSFRSVASLS